MSHDPRSKRGKDVLELSSLELISRMISGIISRLLKYVSCYKKNIFEIIRTNETRNINQKHNKFINTTEVNHIKFCTS